MFDLKPKMVALAALLLLVPILMTACGDDAPDTGAGLSREEVREIVRSEVASVAAPGTHGPDPRRGGGGDAGRHRGNARTGVWPNQPQKGRS